MSDRSKRVEIANDTVEISVRGNYVFNRQVINIPEPKSEYWPAEKVIGLAKGYVSTKKMPKIICLPFTTVDFIMKMQKEIDMSHVGILNYASAKYPGGGFLNGAMAQEEGMAYCSNLYLAQKGSPYYATNRNFKKATYRDNMILSTVTFFKDGDFNLVKTPVTTNVLTCPAVNMREVRNRGEDEKWASEVMYNRMKMILDLLSYCGYKAIVLGPFGCGVFDNDAREIAHNWADLLPDYSFEKVYMLLPGSPQHYNNRVFLEVFSEQS